MTRKIVFEYLPLPNFIMFIMASHQDLIGNRNPKYEKLYDAWLLKKEYEFFFNELMLKSPKTVNTTATFALLFQWPSYFSEENIETSFEIIDLLSKKPSLTALISEFPERENNIKKYMPIELSEKLLESLPYSKNKCKIMLEKYSKLLKELWDREYRKIWDENKKHLIRTAKNLIENFLFEFDFFNAWEEVTGLIYPYSSFNVVGLDSVNFLGTSLLAERDCFRLWDSLEKIYRLIVHEIGTHTLIQESTLKNKKWLKFINENLNDLLKLIESYCAFKTDEICDNVGAKQTDNFISKQFANETQAIKEILEENPKINIFELLLKTNNLIGKNK